MVALGLFLHTYGRATEHTRFCQRPDDSVLITAQLCSSSWLGWSKGGREARKKDVIHANKSEYQTLSGLE